MRVSKWGNSLAVRLPKQLVDDLKLRPGDVLNVVEAGARTVVVAKDDLRQRALDNMRARRWELPADYRFDRDEAHER